MAVQSHIFPEEAFAPAAVTDRPFSSENQMSGAESQIDTNLQPHAVRSDTASSTHMPSSSNTPTPQTCTLASDDVASVVEVSTSPENLASSTSNPTYVSPSAIYGIPKAPPRKSKGPSRRKRTEILTSTPVRQRIALQKQQKEAKQKGGVKKVNKNLFPKKKKPVPVPDTSSENEKMEIEYDDESDCSLDEQIEEEDYVVVNVTEKGRIVRYIARVDELDDDEYEGVFLQKVLGCGKKDSEEMSFIVNEKDEASFSANDVVCKLPRPILVGGTARRSNNVRFSCDLKKWKVV